MVNTYTPDLVFPPGDTLRDLLNAREMQQAELATRIAMSEKAVSHLMNGKMALTHDTALKLERVLGVDATFWTNLENNYREFLTRQKENEEFEKEVSFLKNFPLKELRKLGVISQGKNKVAALKELFSFLGVANSDAWQRQYGTTSAQFRRTSGADDNIYATSVLLRWATAKSTSLELPPFDPEAFRTALGKIRESGRVGEADYLQDLPKILAEVGVSIVIAPSLPKSKVSGAVQWNQKRPFILLTTRHKVADVTWFTFFHEAAHVLLHEGQAFVDTEFEEVIQQEIEANAWAATQIIPDSKWAEFVAASAFTPSNIVNFAQTMALHPGMVLGRLQREKHVAYTRHKQLKSSIYDEQFLSE